MLVRAVAFGAVVALVFTSCGGLPESEFTLRMERRLPKFVDSSGTRSPAGYAARVEFYSSPDTVRVIITDPQHHTVFDQRGTFRWHPRDSYQGHGQIVYPSYTVVSFPSGEDIFEQRAAESVLYLTDDPSLWNSRLASNQALERTGSRRDVQLSHD